MSARSARSFLAARFVPSRSAVGAIARLSFWPVAFVGAEAMTSLSYVLGGALVLGSLLASTCLRSRTREVADGPLAASAALVALSVIIPGFAIARAVLGATYATKHLQFAGSGLMAFTMALSFAAMTFAMRKRDDAPLDANVLALAPAALWMALAAVSARYGADAVHLHAHVPWITRVSAALSVIVSVTAVVVLARRLAWLGRLYRGEALPLRVGPLGEAALPALSDVEPSDAAITEPSEELAPYRAHRSAIAKIPRDARALTRRYGRHLGGAVITLLVATTSSALVFGSGATFAHGSATLIPSRLPDLPGACRRAPPHLRFVALAPLRSLDVEQVAERYRRLGVAARVDAPLPFEPRFLDPARAQLVAEELEAAVAAKYPTRSSDELVVLLTDRDMYLRDTPWRYAFARQTESIAVVSVARMDPSFRWDAAPGFVSHPFACDAVLRARVYKMITRQMVRGPCQASLTASDGSIRRPSVLGLADLDAMSETNL